MPVVFPGQHLHHIAHGDFVAFLFVGDDAVAAGDDQQLVGGVAMPAGSGPLAEVDHAAAEKGAVPIAQQRQAGTADFAAGPTLDGRGGGNGYRVNARKAE